MVTPDPVARVIVDKNCLQLSRPQATDEGWAPLGRGGGVAEILLIVEQFLLF